MNLDPKTMVNQLIDNIPYPVGKEELVQLARDKHLPPQIVDPIDRLPDTARFTSAQDLRGKLSTVPGLGGFVEQ